MRSIFSCICLILVLAQTSAAQSFKVPDNVDLSKPENYAKYEQEVINCATWLESPAAGKDPEAKKAAGSFLLEWVAGCPYVTMNIDARIMPFMETSGDMLIYFITGYTRHALQQKDTSAIKGTAAGLTSVVTIYKGNTSIKKDENIDKIVTLYDQGKLEQWVADQLK